MYRSPSVFVRRHAIYLILKCHKIEGLEARRSGGRKPTTARARLLRCARHFYLSAFSEAWKEFFGAQCKGPRAHATRAAHMVVSAPLVSSAVAAASPATVEIPRIAIRGGALRIRGAAAPLVCAWRPARRRKVACNHQSSLRRFRPALSLARLASQATTGPGRPVPRHGHRTAAPGRPGRTQKYPDRVLVQA